MTSDQWRTVSSRAWRNASVATDNAEFDEARFWVGRARLAARYARRPPC
jgi:hypothetical protein